MKKFHLYEAFSITAMLQVSSKRTRNLKTLKSDSATLIRVK